MIYDAFMVFNEIDLLEIRLNTLDPIVDKFVISESSETFTCLPKPLLFQENRERFKKFEDKIIYVYFPHMIRDKEGKTSLEYEYDQRNDLAKGLIDAKPDDIVILSDLDEIPKSSAVLEAIDKLPAHKNIMAIGMGYYYYSLNLHIGTCRGPVVFYHKQLLGKELNTLQLLRDWHMNCDYVIGGWHYSYVGSPKMVSDKLKAYSRWEYSLPKYWNIDHIAKCQKNLEDIFDEFSFNPERKFTIMPDSELPIYVQENKEKFQHLIYKTEQ